MYKINITDFKNRNEILGVVKFIGDEETRIVSFEIDDKDSDGNSRIVDQVIKAVSKDKELELPSLYVHQMIAFIIETLNDDLMIEHAKETNQPLHEQIKMISDEVFKYLKATLESRELMSVEKVDE